MRRATRSTLALACAAGLALGCGVVGCGLARNTTRAVKPPEAFRPEPIVRVTRHSVPRSALATVALAPLALAPELLRGEAENAPPPAAVVDRLLFEALLDHGVPTLAPSEFPGDFGVGAPGNVVTAAREADLMGASGVLVGRVLRFREREGGPFSVTRPASVSFEVTLYATAGARRLWTARFSHTQQPANTRVMDAARYPGGGVRWLSVEELARWGASRVAKELAKER